MKADDREQIDVIKETYAAKVLELAVSTMRNHRHLGKGPPYLKLGRAVRYRMSDLIEYIEKNRIEPE